MILDIQSMNNLKLDYDQNMEDAEGRGGRGGKRELQLENASVQANTTRGKNIEE